MRLRPLGRLTAALFVSSLLLIVPGTAGATGHAAPTLTGIAGWAGDFGYFNVRAAPRTSAPVVETLQRGQRVRVVATVQGDAVDGIDRWYRLADGRHTAYVLASGISYLDVPVPWTGVISSNAESDVAVVYSLAGPHPDAPSEAQFAPGAEMTVLRVVHGTALETGDDVWYQVSTGSYRPAYVYSAYLKFAHPGAGPVPLPLLSAASALAVDMDSGRVLFSRNPNVARAPASLVKIMTAAVALDHLSPNTVITIPPAAPSVGAEIGGSAMGLIPGQRLSLHDLLYGMLLPSGNDAAFTIADAVAGSQSAFAALMNAKAGALGMTGTHFVQGYGLDAPAQYSTASDLLRLARYALGHYPLFREIVGTSYHYIGVGRTHPAFALHNLDQLLGVYPGAFGVKTGTTPAAGQNLIAAVHRDGHTIMSVVLGATDRYADSTALLDYSVALDQ